jgi:hypothetical protein
MANQFIHDKSGNTIYLTDERWQHIMEFHSEMIGYQQRMLDTVRTGKRKQDSIDPSIYTYYHRFDDLESGYNHIVVIVKFGVNYRGEPNNFILTAWQKFIYS